MGAQKIATGIGLVALAALLLEVGLPAVLPPRPVAEIEVVVPVGFRDETGGEDPGRDDEASPAPRRDDGDDGDDGDSSEGGDEDSSEDDDEESGGDDDGGDDDGSGDDDD